MIRNQNFIEFFYLGGIIACTTIENLDQFCLWLMSNIFTDENLLEDGLQVFF